MVTIKQISDKSGFSASTVSIVLRGESKKRKIPESTQNAILAVAQQLGYTPNIAARKLRDQTASKKPIVAIFWDDDFRSAMMLRFLRGIRRNILKGDSECEIQIIPYNANNLKEVFNPMTILSYNAAIICNASNTDIIHIENNNYNLPIILFNRWSKKYSSVTVDHQNIGITAANIFLANNKKSALFFDTSEFYTGKDDRIDNFMSIANQNGIKVTRVYTSNSTMESAFETMSKIIDTIDQYDCMLCGSDILAIGALKVLMKHRVSIPEDLEIISIGDGDPEVAEFFPLSLSTILLPMESMAEKCLKLATDANTLNTPLKVTLPTKYLKRET